MANELEVKQAGGLKKLVQSWRSMKAKADKAKEETESLTSHAVGTAVAGATGAALGFVEQKLGSRPVANLDAPVIGLVLTGGAALLGVGGKSNEYLFDAAKSCAAVATYKVVKRSVALSDRANEKNADKGILAGDELDDLRNEA